MESKIRIAVAGTGSIGALMGSYLTRAGYDVTMLSINRPQQAQELRRLGLTMEGYGEPFHVDVQAEYLPDVEEQTKYDLIFLTMKSNFMESSVPALVCHLEPDGAVVPMQNGINDDLLLRYITPSQLVTLVTFAGGAQIEPGRYMNHEGSFYVGSANTSAAALVAEVASSVRPTFLSDDIRSVQWDKLARVCLSVPTAAISGVFLGDVFLHPQAQRMFALLALELFAVAQADACPRETVEEKSRETWLQIRDEKLTGLEHADEFEPWPPGIVDAYTADMRRGQPLEIDYTNGAVVRLGRRYGVPTPANEQLLTSIHALERGEVQAGDALLRSTIEAALAR